MKELPTLQGQRGKFPLPVGRNDVLGLDARPISLDGLVLELCPIAVFPEVRVEGPRGTESLLPH